MPKFKVATLPHGYPSVEIEREVVCGAGGELLSACGGHTLPFVERRFHVGGGVIGDFK